MMRAAAIGFQRNESPPAPVERRRPGDAEPLYRMEYDAAAVLILFTVQGFWNYDEVSTYLTDAYAFVTECRRRFGEVNLLSDRRNAQVQAAAIAEKLAKGTSAIGPDDRVAIVVSSSLVKMQLRRSVSHPYTKAFLSMDAARLWLASARGEAA